ncbi:hypothetical protein HZC30_02365, partial [Candidatus Woesearchaeota archaeon]|nr:hypothetical protein [Candidatus Woesearchaeota archaeon]
MSQASKHVDWCLNKAQREIEECKKLGKRIKHRGLIKENPNLDDAKEHLAKAEHNLIGIARFKDIGFSDWSMSAGFYCIYHCFLAIAAKFGYKSGNQTCTISLMKYLKEEKKIALDEKYIGLLESEELEETKGNSVIDLREESKRCERPTAGHRPDGMTGARRINKQNCPMFSAPTSLFLMPHISDFL